MLGVRRPTVTLIMNELERSNAVSASRGRIRIIDRDALESRACECYKATAEMCRPDRTTGAGASPASRLQADVTGLTKLVAGAPIL